MLDPRWLRTDLDDAARQLARRGFALDTAALRALDARRKAAQVRTQELQAERNAKSKEIGRAKAAGQDIQPLLDAVAHLGDALKAAEAELEVIQAEWNAIALTTPNIPHASVPDGRDENDNREERRWGEPAQFGFTPKDHVDLGAALGLMDFESAAKLTGSRFVVMAGPLARLHRALIQFMLDTHTREHGYTEAYVPYLVNAESLRGTGQLPKFEAELFKLAGEQEYYLIPTAEVPVTNLLRDVIVEADDMPRRWVAHTPCFRSEAGSYGKDTRGMIRQHQFEKVELVQAVRPEESAAALEALTGHAEPATPRRSCRSSACRIAWSPCAPVTWASRRPRPTTSRSGCRGRGSTARSLPAPTSRTSRRAGCRRAGATLRPASPSCCIRSTARGLPWGAPWSRCWRTARRRTAASASRRCCGPTWAAPPGWGNSDRAATA